MTSGRIGPSVADRAAAEPRDTVRLSRGEPSGKGGKAGGSDRARATEEEVAREKALADANTRISQLEKTIKAYPEPGNQPLLVLDRTQQTNAALFRLFEGKLHFENLEFLLEPELEKVLETLEARL